MKKITVGILIIIFVWLFLRFVIGGPEDDWIFFSGSWVKHGNLSASQQTGSCSKTIK